MYRPNMLKLNNGCLVARCVSRLNKSDCRQKLLCPSSLPINKLAVPECLTLRRLMSYIYMEHPFLMFLDHAQRRSTVGRTPLDERSAHRRDLYLTTHDTHNRQISMPPVGFEPTISAGERPQANIGAYIGAHHQSRSACFST